MRLPEFTEQDRDLLRDYTEALQYMVDNIYYYRYLCDHFNTFKYICDMLESEIFSGGQNND